MKRILITGGPGTGKTTVLRHLEKRGYPCFQEVSRNIISAAQKRGIKQLFLTHPDEFNEQLLNGRIQQFKDCETNGEDYIFIDRGLPDIIAYNNFINIESSNIAIEATEKHRYDFVFLFPPWKAIYKKDKERYETYQQSVNIYENLKKTYQNLNYEVFEVPIEPLDIRTNYILNIVEYS